MTMELNDRNYYSKEANREFMSVSQYKDFVGTYGFAGCEACAMAKIDEKYSEPPSTAMMIGSYVDRWFEGTLDQFKAENPGIFTASGVLRKDYRMADALIRRVEKDDVFMAFMSGHKQTIMTGELFGAPWKIKIDSYIPGVAVVDLKVMRSLTDLKYAGDLGPLDFIRYWGYDIQGAIYQEIEYQNSGKRLPFFIAGISKEDPPDFEVIHVSDVYLQEALRNVESNMPRILEVKRGEAEPRRCKKCTYCKKTKVLDGPIEISDLMPAI